MGTSRHRITICTTCPYKGRSCSPGYELIARLRASIDAASSVIDDDFEISGVAYVAGCGRPCTVAYYGTPKAAYLFGDVDAEVDVESLVTLARQNAYLADEWCVSSREGEEPTQPLNKNPAAVIALEESELRIS